MPNNFDARNNIHKCCRHDSRQSIRKSGKTMAATAAAAAHWNLLGADAIWPICHFCVTQKRNWSLVTSESPEMVTYSVQSEKSACRKAGLMPAYWRGPLHMDAQWQSHHSKYVRCCWGSSICCYPETTDTRSVLVTSDNMSYIPSIENLSRYTP